MSSHPSPPREPLAMTPDPAAGLFMPCRPVIYYVIYDITQPAWRIKENMTAAWDTSVVRRVTTMRGEQIGRERVPVMVSFLYGGSRLLLRGSDDARKQFLSLSKGFPLDRLMPVPVACFQRPGGLGQSISR